MCSDSTGNVAVTVSSLDPLVCAIQLPVISLPSLNLYNQHLIKLQPVHSPLQAGLLASVPRQIVCKPFLEK